VFFILENNQTIAINTIFKNELNTKRVVIPISPANGPEIIIANGDANVTIVITFDMTRPCLSGGITVCRIVKNMVLTKGTINAKIKPPILITMKFMSDFPYKDAKKYDYYFFLPDFFDNDDYSPNKHACLD